MSIRHNMMQSLLDSVEKIYNYCNRYIIVRGGGTSEREMYIVKKKSGKTDVRLKVTK